MQWSRLTNHRRALIIEGRLVHSNLDVFITIIT